MGNEKRNIECSVCFVQKKTLGDESLESLFNLKSGRLLGIGFQTSNNDVFILKMKAEKSLFLHEDVKVRIPGFGSYHKIYDPNGKINIDIFTSGFLREQPGAEKEAVSSTEEKLEEVAKVDVLLTAEQVNDLAEIEVKLTERFPSMSTLETKGRHWNGSEEEIKVEEPETDSVKESIEEVEGTGRLILPKLVINKKKLPKKKVSVVLDKRKSRSVNF